MLACVARLTPATQPGRQPSFTMRTLAWERWQYGRWLLATVCLETAVAPAVTFIVTATLGLAAVGTLRAMQTFVAPLGHGMIGAVEPRTAGAGARLRQGQAGVAPEKEPAYRLAADGGGAGH